MCGEKFPFDPGSLVGSWLGNGECRRLTIRGLIRPRLLVRRSVAASRSKSANRRRRNVGRAGGKGVNGCQEALFSGCEGAVPVFGL